MNMRKINRAFTLVELLVVVGIIALVVSILLVAIRTMGAAGRQTDSVNSVRQLAVAHAAYAMDHKGMFIPGYLNESLLAPPPSGLDIHGRYNDIDVPDEAARTWVWRLSPYTDDSWRLMFRDFRDGGLMEKLDAELKNNEFDTVAMTGAYGLNSIFVGGDSDHGGGEVTDDSPWNSSGNPTIAATRISQVRKPAELLLFMPVTSADAAPGTELVTGHYEARAPFLKFAQWSVGPKNEVVQADTLDKPAGLPISRFGGENIAVSTVDGSATVVPLSHISVDMRRWAPFADAIEWRVP
jgi:prepilin-type N-terminal cleavage/methylation domain-containing protein